MSISFGGGIARMAKRLEGNSTITGRNRVWGFERRNGGIGKWMEDGWRLGILKRWMGEVWSLGWRFREGERNGLTHFGLELFFQLIKFM